MSESLTREQKQRLRKLKKKVYKINYLNEELADVLETIEEYSQEFYEAMTKWLKANDADDVFEQMFTQRTEEEILSEINLDEELESKPKNSKTDPWVKEIYRQLASETHSDKIAQRDDLSDIEKLERNQLFIEANKALQQNDGPALYIMAINLGLKMSNVPDDILEYFDKSIKELQAKISSSQSSNAWFWAESSFHKRASFIKNINEKFDITATESEIAQFLNDYTE